MICIQYPNKFLSPISLLHFDLKYEMSGGTVYTSIGKVCCDGIFLIMQAASPTTKGADLHVICFSNCSYCGMCDSQMRASVTARPVQEIVGDNC